MTTPLDLARIEARRFTKITAEQIRAAAAWANFGGEDPVKLVCHGLLQITGGFRTGYTVQSILQDLRLVGPAGKRPTKLGRLFLYDLYCRHDPRAALTTPADAKEAT